MIRTCKSLWYGDTFFPEIAGTFESDLRFGSGLVFILNILLVVFIGKRKQRTSIDKGVSWSLRFEAVNFFFVGLVQCVQGFMVSNQPSEAV